MNNVEKSHTTLAFLLLANRDSLPLTRQLEVVIEVSTVQEVRLRTNPWQLREAKYLPPTAMHTGFHNGQASYFNMKVLVSAGPEHM